MINKPRTEFSARLEDRLELPTSWSYCDSSENNIQEGFQVWLPYRAVYAATGRDCDGSYGIESGYKYVIILEHEPQALTDSVGEWFSLLPEDVISSYYVSISDCLNWAFSQWQNDLASGYDLYEENFAAWCEDSEEEIMDWLNLNKIKFDCRFVNSLE